MTHMGSVSIFSLDFSGTKFACSRTFVGGYMLQAGSYTLSMTAGTASALASAGERIRGRARIAAHYDREMRSGATFRRDMVSVDGRAVRIEFGVADDGGGIYIEVGITRMTLTDAQSQLLLFTLDRLGADVASISQAGGSAQPHQLNLIGPQTRGFAYPWETDPQW
jgi:hypothetical protein